MKLRERMHEAQDAAIIDVLNDAPLSEVLDDVADVLSGGGGGQQIAAFLRARAVGLRDAVKAYAGRPSAEMLLREIGELKP